MKRQPIMSIGAIMFCAALCLSSFIATAQSGDHTIKKIKVQLKDGKQKKVKLHADKAMPEGIVSYWLPDSNIWYKATTFIVNTTESKEQFCRFISLREDRDNDGQVDVVEGVPEEYLKTFSHRMLAVEKDGTIHLLGSKQMVYAVADKGYDIVVIDSDKMTEEMRNDPNIHIVME